MWTWQLIWPALRSKHISSSNQRMDNKPSSFSWNQIRSVDKQFDLFLHQACFEKEAQDKTVIFGNKHSDICKGSVKVALSQAPRRGEFTAGQSLVSCIKSTRIGRERTTSFGAAALSDGNRLARLALQQDASYGAHVTVRPFGVAWRNFAVEKSRERTMTNRRCAASRGRI